MVIIRIASLFSGIGGFEKGMLQANPDIELVFSSEIDKYARQIYIKNFGVEPHGDITKINATAIPDHDILCGGF
ncbi:MAG: DNA cytosine methyltransferase, partial [bacterium]|nr:DNA cytosine methyltransferase [bacterium]